MNYASMLMNILFRDSTKNKYANYESVLEFVPPHDVKQYKREAHDNHGNVYQRDGTHRQVRSFVTYHSRIRGEIRLAINELTAAPDFKRFERERRVRKVEPQKKHGQRMRARLAHHARIMIKRSS